MNFKDAKIKQLKYIFIILAVISIVAVSGMCVYSASYSRGDADLNGKVTTSDVRTILRYVAEKQSLSSTAKICADYDGDGNVTPTDARLCMLSVLTDGELLDVQTSESVRAIWVATAAGDFPSLDNLSADKLKAEIDKIVSTAAENGLNTIFFQVRPYSDAFYNSSIFPTSTILVENQGDKAPLDCLAYFIEAAHSKNISLHAWINPYRITSTSHSASSLSSSNPAMLHPEWVVKHFDENGNAAGLWYDPGLPEVRNLIMDGVKEIINNYNVDGIHFDDYFYPYTNAAGFEDNSTYEKYGNGKNIADWRRENVNVLIKGVYDTIKNKSQDIDFGVSPFGIWAKKTSSMPNGVDGIGWTLQSYSDIYADSRTWVVNNWVDYICPQVYWEMAHAKAPFKTVVDWWDELCGKSGVDLYIGIGVYNGENPNSAFADSSEVLSQLTYLNQKQNVNGASFFTYRNLVKDTGNITQTLKTVYSKYIDDMTDIPYPEIPSSMPAYSVNTDGAELMEKTGNSSEYGPTEYCLAPMGMRESVVDTVFAYNGEVKPQLTEYAILSNGLYIRKDQLTYLSGELYKPTIIFDPYFEERDKYTDLIIQCSQNVSNTVWLGDNEAVVTLYGIYNPESINVSSLLSNKLFSSVRLEQVDNTTIKIILSYKSKQFIFGYSSCYENGNYKVSFRNPVPISSDPEKPLTGIKISLDPGHSLRGGATASYNGVKYYEEDWNLELAQKVKQRLEALGATVRLSHNGEWEKSLSQLIPEIISWDPDINISIHFNSASNTSANGNSVWWCYRNSAFLAKSLVNNFSSGTGLKNNGYPMGMYQVSRFCKFPSVLFETLFMSNQSDVSWYLTEGNKDRTADSLTNAVVEYFRSQS